MLVVKMTNRSDGSRRYVASRSELAKILDVSKQSMSRVTKILAEGGVANTRGYMVQMVEIDESSIKEVVS